MTGARRQAVFLDRDGTLNESTLVEGIPRPPASLNDLRIFPDVAAACRQLKAAGLVLIGVTNQPDIARRATSSEIVAQLNEAVARHLGLDRILMCPHDDRDRCTCRKPLPGLLQQGSRELNIDLARSVMVGDSWRDVEAGRRAGCATVLIDHGYHGHGQHVPGVPPDLSVHSLREAVPWILDFVNVDLQPVESG